jgi:hypothetical protein
MRQPPIDPAGDYERKKRTGERQRAVKRRLENRSPIPGNVQVKFDTGPEDTARKAEETNQLAGTIRYGFSKGISEQDTIDLIRPDGEKFGTAEVVMMIENTVKKVWKSINRLGILYGSDSLTEIVDSLNYYYEHNLTTDTEVTLMIYEPSINE